MVLPILKFSEFIEIAHAERCKDKKMLQRQTGDKTRQKMGLFFILLFLV